MPTLEETRATIIAARSREEVGGGNNAELRGTREALALLGRGFGPKGLSQNGYG